MLLFYYHLTGKNTPYVNTVLRNIFTSQSRLKGDIWVFSDFLLKITFPVLCSF